MTSQIPHPAAERGALPGPMIEIDVSSGPMGIRDHAQFRTIQDPRHPELGISLADIEHLREEVGGEPVLWLPRSIVETPEEVLRAIDDRLEIRPKSAMVTLDGDPVDVTLKQLTVLTVLGRNVGQVVKFENFYRALWDDERPDTYDNVLQVQVSRTRGKLGKARRGIRTVRKVGYMLRSTLAEPLEEPGPIQPSSTCEIVNNSIG